MADKKISELAAATALTGTEQFPVVQGGVTKRTTVADLSGAFVSAFGIVRVPHSAIATGLITIGSANDTRYYRVVEGGTISKVRLLIGTSSGNLCVAAYSNAGTGLAAAPAAQLASSGSVVSPGTGIRDISLGSSVVLLGGDWLAVSADNITITFAGIVGAGDSTLSAGMNGVQTTAFPCPSPAGVMAPGNNRLISCVGVA